MISLLFRTYGIITNSEHVFYSFIAAKSWYPSFALYIL